MAVHLYLKQAVVEILRLKKPNKVQPRQRFYDQLKIRLRLRRLKKNTRLNQKFDRDCPDNIGFILTKCNRASKTHEAKYSLG